MDKNLLLSYHIHFEDIDEILDLMNDKTLDDELKREFPNYDIKLGVCTEVDGYSIKIDIYDKNSG